MTEKTREGFFYGLVAYGWWGLVPLYFRWLRDEVRPEALLAHRIVWSGLFLAVVLTLSRRWGDVGRCLYTRRLVGPLLLSALLIAGNWLVYIFSVAHERITQASLGYYITPLVSVLLGLFVFREHLRPLQWLALILASAGVLAMTIAGGELPWIGLALACSFSLYGLIRKQVPVDGLVGLAVETVLLMPAALVYLALPIESTASPLDWSLLWRLMLSGIITAVPLLCFGQAARRLPLSVLGFFQYVSPSIQFLLAVFLFHEKLPEGAWGSFTLIWLALALFSLDSVRRLWPSPRPCQASP